MKRNEPPSISMETNRRRFVWAQVLPAVIATMLTAYMIFVPDGTGDRSPENNSIPPTVSAPQVRAPEVSAPEKGGCADWGNRRLRSINSGVMTVQYSVGLGRVSDNGNTGRITLAEKVITRNSYTPDVLALSVSTVGNDIELIRDPSRPQRVIADPGEKGGYTSQSIKQIRAPEAFVDIVVLSEWEYEIRFYHPAQVTAKRNGFYGVSGEPYSVTRVRNPNPPNTNGLDIIITKDGTTKKSEYRYDEGSDTWLYYEDGVETVKKLSEVNPGKPCERIETRFDLKEGNWFKTVKIYRAFPWGQDIITKIEDPDGQARTTTYKYFDDPDGPHYTFLKTTIHPDGKVEKHNRHPDPFKKWASEPLKMRP